MVNYMAQIKSYTDIEQSKKLAEILPMESADMLYTWDTDNKTYYPLPIVDDKEHDFPSGLPCWSLAALRNLLPPAIKPNKNIYLFESHKTFDKSWVYRYYNEDSVLHLYCKNKNEVDACVNMIIKLSELKML